MQAVDLRDVTSASLEAVGPAAEAKGHSSGKECTSMSSLGRRPWHVEFTDEPMAGGHHL